MPPQLSSPDILKPFEAQLRPHTNKLSSIGQTEIFQTYESTIFSTIFSRAESNALFTFSQPPMSESVEWVSSFVGDAPPGEVRLMSCPLPR